MNLHRMKNISLGLLVCAGIVSAAPAKATELKYATFRSTTSSAMTQAFDPFAKAVTKETGGSLQFKVFPSGQLGTIRTTLASVRNGVADAALVIPVFLRGELPHVNVLVDMLFFGNDSAAIAGATLETMHFHCPECQEDFAKQNAISLGGFATTPYHVQCASEVRKFSDLKGLKTRVAGGAQNRIAKALGMVGVQIAPPKLVEAMQRGQIQCTLAPLAWLNQFSLKDGVKYIIDFPLGVIRAPDLFTVNKNFWAKLSRREKGAIIKHMPMAVARTIMVSYYGDDKGALNAAMQKGAVVTKGDAAFTRAVAKLGKNELDLIRESAKKKGIKNPQRIINAHLRLLKKWEKLQKKFGKDPEKFAKVLWDEVYSKISY